MQQESQLYVDQLNQQLHEQFEQTLMYKAELANMDSENLARKKECNQFKKTIEKYETDMKEKDEQHEIANQKLVAAEKEIIDIGRELR